MQLYKNNYKDLILEKIEFECTILNQSDMYI